jgi:hypothetical protein
VELVLALLLALTIPGLLTYLAPERPPRERVDA